MGEAEEIIRARERQTARTTAQAAARAQRNAVSERETTVESVRRDAARLLKALADAGYPDGRMLRVLRGMSFFGRERYVEKAAWAICEYPSTMHGDAVTGTVYLLSDGGFAHTPRGSTVELQLDELVAGASQASPSLGLIAQGLSDAIARYTRTTAHATDVDALRAAVHAEPPRMAPDTSHPMLPVLLRSLRQVPAAHGTPTPHRVQAIERLCIAGIVPRAEADRLSASGSVSDDAWRILRQIDPSNAVRGPTAS